jgi:hypothetical protein
LEFPAPGLDVAEVVEENVRSIILLFLFSVVDDDD